MPTSLHSFRSPEHRRKQTVRSEQELDRLYRAWDARRQEAEMEEQLAAPQRQAAEEARNVRHARQAATLQKQAARAEQQRQQVQALEATRTKHKGSAAAARRAKLDATVEVQVNFQAYTCMCRCPTITHVLGDGLAAGITCTCPHRSDT